MIYTQLCELLGIKAPIFQGGMAHISDARLAAAVSESGALGIISAASGNLKYIEEQIELARTLTDKPFGVNVMLKSENVEEIAELLAKKKVSVITTGAGNPSRFMEQWKAAGIKVIPVIPSSALAKMVERAGADAVIAEGGESGGHVGELTTMALVPQVCAAVDIPVIAAGGIYGGSGMAAAFMLGACGVQLGTRFLSAFECNISRTYKDYLLKAKDTSTILTGKRLGHPVRSLKTPFSREYARAEYSVIDDDSLENMALGSLRAAVVDGDEKKGCFIAGQISGLVNKEQPAREIVEEILEETEKCLKEAGKWVK